MKAGAMKAEHICPGERAGYRRYLKWAVRRARRRAEKRDPQEAPIKNFYRGWSI
jgi:hypothetical protein